MTAREIAHQLHGKKAGTRYMCRCPTSLHRHGDRNRSLSVWESDDGWVRLHCFTGCQRDEILLAMGIKVRDLALNEFLPNREWEQRRKDEDRLKLLERQHGLAIMAQAALPEERNYWRAAERNIAVRGRALKRKLYPEEASLIDRQREVQRILDEYGVEEMMECADPGYPQEDGPNTLGGSFWTKTKKAGEWKYLIHGIPESAGKFAGERCVLIYEAIPWR